MQMHFYKNEKLIKDIIVKNFDDFRYEINDEDTKMEIIIKPDIIITRDSEDAYFKLDISNNSCIYKLKSYNLCYDIDVIQSRFSESSDEIVIEYRLNTDEELNKIIIKKDV